MANKQHGQFAYRDQGELRKLHELLGPTRNEKIDELWEKYNDDALVNGYKTILPNKRVARAFFTEMGEIIGEEETVNICSRFGVCSTCSCEK